MEWKQRVAIRKKLSELVEDRNTAMELVQHGAKAIDQAERKLREVGSYGLGIDGRFSLEAAQRRIDAELWRLAFKRTGMTQIMDAKATKQFHDSLERKPPAFTMENIESQFLEMYQTADEMFLRGIYEVFARLSWDYKTNENQPYQLSNKNIIEWACSWWSGRCSVEYSKADMFNDIDRCVRVLTGREHFPHELETRINTALKEFDGSPAIYEDDDYHMKFYKNGNCHLTFKNDDTVVLLNRAIAKYCGRMQLREECRQAKTALDRWNAGRAFA